MNTRRIQLIYKILKNTQLNTSLLKYVNNRLAWLHVNKRKTTVIPYPTGIMLELGNRCNLHCKMCAREFEYGKEMNQGFMKLEDAIKIVNEILPYLDSIGLTGLGETFMYPHMLELVKYIKSKKRNIIITVSTNAHFKGFLENIIPTLPYIDNIQFSIDGTDKIYEYIRPNTDFNFITENIKTILREAKDTVFMTNTVIMQENLNNLHDIVEYAYNLGIRNINFNQMNLAAMPQEDITKYNLYTSENYKSEIGRIEEFKKKYPDVNITGLSIQKKSGFRQCPYTWHHQYITWDGYLVPCCTIPFPKLSNFGNVLKDGVLNSLNSKASQQFRKAWIENAHPAFCSRCTYINLYDK